MTLILNVGALQIVKKYRGSMTKAMMTQEAAKRVQQSVNKRYAAERRFQLIGKLAIATALGFLVILMSTIVSKGVPGFQHYIQLDVTLDAVLDPRGDASVDSLFDGNPRKVCNRRFMLKPVRWP